MINILKKYLSTPVSFIDIGALGYTYEPLHFFSSLFWYHGFDPVFADDSSKNKKLQNEKKRWLNYSIHPYALDKKNGFRKFNIYSSETNNSFLKSNEILRKRYNMQKKWTIKKNIKLNTKTLDHILYKTDDKSFGDVIKVDTQGTELDILKGSKKVLKNCKFLISEVSFVDLYKKQCLFSDLEIFLRSKGFSFYAFTDIFYRSKKYFDKRKYFGRERMIYGDAIFIKDPFDKIKKNKFKNLDLIKIFLTSVAFELYDFALELLNNIQISKNEKSILKQEVFKMAKKTREKFSSKNINLLEQEKLISNFKFYSNLNEYF